MMSYDDDDDNGDCAQIYKLARLTFTSAKGSTLWPWRTLRIWDCQNEINNPFYYETHPQPILIDMMKIPPLPRRSRVSLGILFSTASSGLRLNLGFESWNFSSIENYRMVEIETNSNQLLLGILTENQARLVSFGFSIVESGLQGVVQASQMKLNDSTTKRSKHDNISMKQKVKVILK